MKQIFAACVLGLMTLSAVAAEKLPVTAPETNLVCNSYGFAPDASEFHSIDVVKQQTSFKITSTTVILDGVVYDTINPEMVGLDGLAITYHAGKNNKLLYLYVTDKGKREVGISSIEPDSDTIFRDKAVYKDCYFKEEVSNGTTQQVLRTSRGGINNPLPVYVL